MFESLVGGFELRAIRAPVLVAWVVACAAVAVAVAVGWSGSADHGLVAPVKPVATHVGGLSRLPADLQPVASSAVGAARPGFVVHRLHAVGGGLATVFGRSGPTVRAGEGALEIKVSGVGGGKTVSAVQPASPVASHNQVLYRRGGLTEWYRNGPLGLEQGFTVTQRPASGTGWLTISEQLRGAMHARLSGSGIQFSRNGHSLLRLERLSATDASGRALRSHFELSGSSVLLRIDDAGAAYPVKVDPMIRQAELNSGDNTYDQFGYSVALSSDGNTALIGGVGANAGAGAAWVFTRSGTTWSKQAEITPSNEATQGQFGASVALSSDGNTALIGGAQDNSNKDATWVFTRSATSWSQRAELTANDETGQGAFGASVVLSSDGNTALIGGPADNSSKGAAWVFTRSGSTWTQQGSKITPSDESGNGSFGSSVGLSSDASTALIGGPADSASGGAAWVFTGSGSSWTEVSKLTVAGGGQFGTSVAVSSDGATALIGAPRDGASTGLGAAYAFTSSGSTWTQQGPKLTPNDAPYQAAQTLFGASVALSADGNTALIGAPGFNNPDQGLTLGQGAAWLFSRAGSTWAQTQPMTAGCCSAASGFGSSVALSGDNTTALVGAPRDGSDDNFVYQNYYGAAFVYTVDVTPPSPFSLIAPADQANISSQPTFSWNQTTDTGTGVDHYELLINGREAQSVANTACSVGVCSATARPPLGAGSQYTWSVQAVDGEGNTRSSETRSFNFDTTPPAAFSLIAPADGVVVAAPPSFSWQASSDAGSGIDHYELWIDGSKNRDVATTACSGGTCSTTASALVDGHHSWLVTAVDGAGNTTTSNQTRSFTLDTTPPAAFSLISPANGAQNRAPRTSFSWQQTTDSLTGIDHYELWIDGTKNQNVANSACSGGTCSATATSALPDGSHSWRVNAVDGAGNVQSSGPRSFSVTAPPAIISRPTISGKATQGQTLTESHGSWSGNPTGYQYQWEDCDISVANCVAIPGATAQTYTLTSGDVGHRMVVLETASNAGGPGVPATSNATDPVAPLAPVNLSPPTIAGTAAIGHTLTEAHGTWTNSPSSYTYQWESCNSAGANCSQISGAKSQSYVVQSGDVARTLAVLETAANQSGRVAALSATTAPVPPAGPVGVLMNNGDYATNNPYVGVNLVWPAGAKQVVLSNDGGFGSTGNAKTFSLAAKIPWTLKRTGADRIPKIIYVRYIGAGIDLVTFTDDIVLDETAPTVQSAELISSNKSSAHRGRGGRHRYAIQLKAGDPIVGLCSVQVSSQRSGGTTVRLASCHAPGRLSLNRTMHITTGRTPRYVRVKNSAGSWSRWRKLS